MRNFIAVAVVVLLAGSAARAQDKLPGRGKFLIDVDYARFHGSEEQAFVEVYYGIHENAITYVPGDTGYRGGVTMSLVVTSDTAIVASKEWLVPHLIPDSLRMASSQILTGIESFGLPRGAYTLRVVAIDMNDRSRRDSLAYELPIAVAPNVKEAMSDLEMCTMIQASSNKESIFYKNTLEVTPNPARLFGIGLPIMYYYVELYNLEGKGVSASAVLRTTVVNAAGKEVFTKDKTKPRTPNSSVEVGTVNLSALRGGTYTLNLLLLQSAKGETLTSASKKFFIYRPGMGIDSSLVQARDGLMGSEYAVMTEMEVDREIGYISYLMTDPEGTQLKLAVDLQAKRKFLFEFWKRRDINPQTGGNLVKKEYMKRIEYAEQHYTSGMRKGWKSDRGRVHVIYGPYDEIERFPSTPEANPYEIWHYLDIQGGVIFVFVDKNAMGDYVLVHSTHRDELQYRNWYQDYASKSK